MTIDERLERLVDRHEALAQSVELLVSAQLQNERLHEKNEKLQQKNEVVMANLMESVNSLANVARIHERRITDIEGGRA